MITRSCKGRIFMVFFSVLIRWLTRDSGHWRELLALTAGEC